jgi:hypothetical protein
MHGVGVPASDSQSHLHSHHSLDSAAEMVATAASVTVSNLVGMVGTEAGLSVQTAAMKVQWYVSPVNVLPTSCYHHCLLSVSIDKLNKADAQLIPEAYMPHLTLRRPCGVYLPSLTLAVQKLPTGSTGHVRTPGSFDPTTLP